MHPMQQRRHIITSIVISFLISLRSSEIRYFHNLKVTKMCVFLLSRKRQFRICIGVDAIQFAGNQALVMCSVFSILLTFCICIKSSCCSKLLNIYTHTFNKSSCRFIRVLTHIFALIRFPRQNTFQLTQEGEKVFSTFFPPFNSLSSSLSFAC